MTKEERKIVEKYCEEYGVNPRTQKLIVIHYIDCGEKSISKLTTEWIENYYQELLEKEKKIEMEGRISLISPDFVCYLLKCCMGLYKLKVDIRHKIIKEWL